MTAKGHVTLASVGALLTVKYVFLTHHYPTDDYELLVIFYASVIFGSLFPDIDESGSYIGRKFLAISIVTSSFMKHRTFTHYLIFPALVFYSSFFVDVLWQQYLIYGLALGILLHDAGDMLTKGGINGFFFPFFPKTKIALLPRVLRFYTGSVTEYIFIFFLMLCKLFLFFSIFTGEL